MLKAALLLFVLLAQTDTIRVNTRLVEVNVVVRDKSGPLANLTKDDFTILDNKKQQRIDVFSVLDTRKAGAQNNPSLPPGAVANRLDASGGVPPAATVILFDLINTAVEFQKDAIKELVNYLRTMRTEDRISLYLLGTELRVIQDFTGDRDKLVRAAARIKALDTAGTEVRSVGELVDLLEPPPVSSDAGDPVYLRSGAGFASAMSVGLTINQATATADTFEYIAQHLTGIPGRKNLIWMSAGFPFAPIAVTEPVGTTRRLIRETPDNFSSQLDRASRAMNNANVALYPVDVRSLAGSYPEVMLRLADATGGRASYYSNDLQGAVRGAVSDGEVSYTLGFYSSADKSDKTFHNLSVKVNRKDAEVRHRAGYYPADTQKPTDQQRQAMLGDALGSPLNASQLGLTATAVPDPTTAGNYRVTIVVDARDIQFEQQNDRRVATLTLATRMESSKSRNAQTATIPLKLSEDQFRNVLTRGFVLASSVAGNALDRLRIVIQDQSSGVVGSLWLPLDPGR